MKPTENRKRMLLNRKCSQNNRLTLLAVVYFVFIPIASDILALDFYVSPSGNDINSGSITSPLETISAGILKLKAGDILFVRAGTYTEELHINQSGTADKPITINAYPGEKPVIDGEDRLPASQWNSLVTIEGNYIVFTGFEIKNSNGMAVILLGLHNRAVKIIAHHAQENGILICGDYGVAENCIVYQCDRSNSANPGHPASGYWSTGISAARSPLDGITTNAIIRRNIVYNNWGEGISSFEAEGTLIEDNIVYDNWSVNLYISDTRNALVQRNIVYNTPGNIVGQRRPFTLGDENANVPRSSGNVVINNFIYNCDLWAFWSTGVPGSGLDHIIIANNTIVNGQLQIGASVADQAYNASGTICNNIFFTDSGNPWEIMGSLDRLSFSNNLWSKSPPEALAGTDDIVDDPGLERFGNTGPGELNGDYFRLKPNSPAINKGISLEAVKVDFFMTPRDADPDIGGFEHVVSTGIDDIPDPDSNHQANNGNGSENPDTTAHGDPEPNDSTVVVSNSIIRLTPSGNETLERLILYNISGIRILDRNVTGEKNIDISGLPSGLYVLVLSGKTFYRSTTRHRKIMLIH